MNTRSKYMNPLAIGFIMLALGMTFALAQFKVVPVMAPEQVALMMTVFTLTGVILSLPAGGLVQKFGPKVVVLWGTALLIVGSVIGGLVEQGSAVMVVSRTVEGIGYALLTVAGPATVAMYTQPDKVGRAMGIWVCWVSVGQIIAFNVTPVLLGSLSFGNIWFIYAAVSLLAAILVQFTLKAPSADASSSKDAPAQTEKVSLSMAINKDIIFTGIAYCGFNCMMLAVLNFGANSAVEAGMTMPQALFMASIPMIGCFLSGPAFGNISLKVGCKKLFLLGLVGSIVGTIMIFSSSIPLIYVGAVIFGLTGLGVPPMAFSSVPQLVKDPRLIGLGTGIMTTFQSLGMLIPSMFFLSFPAMAGSNFMGALIWTIPIGVISIILVMASKFK